LAYWHNTPRNRQVVAIAQAAATNDRRALLRAGFRPEDLLAMRDPPGAVVVLVESLEHARVIQGLLPDWAMVSPVGEDPGVAMMPAVVTTAYAATHGVPADVIISAVGTEWPVRIRGFPGRRGRTAPPEMLLIDFVDAFDPRAARDAERRVADYRHRSMTVVTAMPAAGD
jgi:hypothetical protein